MVLRRRVTLRATPPISLVLATLAKEYVAALDATRHAGPATAPDMVATTNRWIALFAVACRRAVADALSFEQRIAEIQATWLEKLGRPRADAAARLLVERLPAAPILTVTAAAAVTGRTFAAANRAVASLVDAGILTPSTLRRRDRTYEAREIIDAFTNLERPARRVPPRSREPGT